jgi:cytochrome c oxidase subunit 2
MNSFLFLAGAGIQSALEPAGEHAARIGHLWDIFLVVSAAVWLLVMMALLIAIARRNHAETAGGSRRAKMAVSIATAITGVIMFGLLTASVLTGRAIVDSAPRDVPQLKVTGRQWWWQVEYDDPDPSKRFTDANEIHIPVGVPVNVQLHSTDVIHSFWVPNLNGKQDLIPGHDGSIQLRAERPGVYRGQCAEFCGQQHAKMALWIDALTPSDYEKWLAASRQPSKIPSTPEERKGQQVFMSSPCPLCHTIQGTDANGKTGPDLTHFGSRRSIAAGTLPNRRGYLAGWILDPQHLKPGSQMPPMLLEEGELQPLLAYLESLQ